MPRSLGSDEDLTALINSFAIQRPTLPTVPQWDLAFVLDGLTRTPFEPMASVPIRYVAKKAAFLVALASGRRRSELHALMYTGYEHTPDWDQVILHTDPSFIAKNQAIHGVSSDITPIIIPALSQVLGKDLPMDLLLCPVRALRYYILRTEPTRRASQDRLFISLYPNGPIRITSATLSHWIKDCVLYIYEHSSTRAQTWYHIRTHDIRGLASSWALLRHTPLEDILRACYWRSHNTFIQHYLSNLITIRNRMFALGPVVTAGRIHTVPVVSTASHRRRRHHRRRAHRPASVSASASQPS